MGVPKWTFWQEPVKQKEIQEKPSDIFVVDLPLDTTESGINRNPKCIQIVCGLWMSFICVLIIFIAGHIFMSPK